MIEQCCGRPTDAPALEIKVLHVIPSVDAAHGGPSRAIRMIDSVLVANGIYVETATTDDNGTRGRSDRESGRLVLEEGSRLRYFRKTFHGYKVSIHFALWMFKHVRNYNIVHIHALFSFTSTISAFAARISRVPYIVRPLGTLGVYGLSKRRPLLKRISLAVIEGPNVRRAAAVHFTSNEERQEAEALGLHARGHVIPLGVQAVDISLSAEAPMLPDLSGAPYVLYLSRLDPKKNVEGLLGAIALCKPLFPDLKWMIAGSGPSDNYVAFLREYASRLDISDRVVWVGHIDGREKAAAFAGAQLFVLPSFSENFGIAAVEAMSAGLPVVLGKGVAVSARAQSAGAGKAVDPDPRSIATAVVEYLRDPIGLNSASINARALARDEFSVERMGKELIKLYKSIVLELCVSTTGTTKGQAG